MSAPAIAHAQVEWGGGFRVSVASRQRVTKVTQCLQVLWANRSSGKGLARQGVRRDDILLYFSSINERPNCYISVVQDLGTKGATGP